MERWTEGAQHFENGLETNQRMGGRPWVAHTQTDYARMLRIRDGRGDRDRVQVLLRAARTTYRELEMDGYAASAAAIAQEAGARM